MISGVVELNGCQGQGSWMLIFNHEVQTTAMISCLISFQWLLLLRYHHLWIFVDVQRQWLIYDWTCVQSSSTYHSHCFSDFTSTSSATSIIIINFNMDTILTVALQRLIHSWKLLLNRYYIAYMYSLLDNPHAVNQCLMIW